MGIVSGSSSPADVVGVHVDTDNRQQAHPVNTSQLAELLAATLAAQQGPILAEVGLAFIPVEEMTALNIEHMGGAGPTDVLAFPIDGVGEPVAAPKGQPAILGDIVICPAVAADAPQDLADELALLVVHGALHLVGHDHAEPEETAIMQALERDMLARFYRP